MTKDETLKLALEALTYLYAETTAYEDDVIDKAITAIKEALAQPEQEPIAMTKTWFEGGKVFTQNLTAKDVYKEPVPLPVQEPVAKAWKELTLACQRVALPEQSIELRDALDRFADAVSEYDARPLTLDYIQGHKHGCEWSAQLAEATDPRTSDWLYDDPHELAKALRKGPEFPPSPPQRTWVGLTDEEWESMYDKFAKYQEYGAFVSGWDNFARAIEAKLKEKNFD